MRSRTLHAADVATRPTRSKPRLLVASIAVVGLLFVTAATTAPAQAVDAAPAWVATWGAAASNLSNLGDCTPCTVRNTVHTSLGGGQVRVTMSNVLGLVPLTITSTNVSLPASYNSSASIPGTRMPVTFSGNVSVTIPVGQTMTSDPVAITVRPDTDLQVSSYYADNTQLTYHFFGTRKASYVWRGTDQSNADTPIAATGAYASIYVVAAVDVLPGAQDTAPAGSVVVFGDSITDGTASTDNADDRWADRLADRLSSVPAQFRLGVVNEGISGNRVLQDGTGPSALSRFQRDVVMRAGVRSVIILEGINDLRAFSEPVAPSTTQQLIDGLETLATTARAANIVPIGATILPFKGRGEYTAGREAVRQAVNDWIRTTDAYDSYVDFDAVIDDPANPGAMRPDYDSGDHLHPGPVGIAAMADEIDLGALGAYEQPGSVQLYAPTSVVRSQATHLVAQVTANEAVQNASIRFTLPTGWTYAAGSSSTVQLGALAAGESAVASLAVSARTPGGLSDVHVTATASLDGKVTSSSQQIRTTRQSSTPDVTLPTTSLTVAPSTVPASGWYTTPVTVDVTAEDDQTGFLFAERRVDGGTWDAHVDPFVLSDGRHIVEARSTDAIGNLSAVVNRQVAVDTTAPTVSSSLNSAARLLSLVASDTTSGVAAVTYRIASGAWTPYATPVALGSKATTVSFRATDKAGNVSVAGSTSVPAAPARATSSVTTKVTPSGKVRFGDHTTVAVTVSTSTGTAATGTIVVSDGARTVGTANLSKGKASLVLPKNLKVGKHRLTVRYNGSSTVDASSRTLSLKVSKARTSVTAKVSRTTTTKRGKVTAQVSTAGDARGRVKVTVVRGKKTVVSTTVKVTKRGKATLRLPRLTHAGRYKVTVRFQGSSSAAKATARTTLTVR